MDVMRIFAIICVVVCHSPAPYDGLAGGRFFISAYNYYTMSGGVCLFFMISGALLLSRPMPYIQFMKRRLSRILSPIIVWSVIYLMLDLLVYKRISTMEFWHSLAMIPFGPQVPLLWFLYAILALYLVFPILSRWLADASRKEVEILLLLWGVTLFVPYLKHVDMGVEGLIKSGTGYLYFFHSFIGYSLLGYYLYKYKPLQGKIVVCWLLLTFALLLPGFLQYACRLPHDAINNVLTPNVVLLTMAYFLVFTNTSCPNFMRQAKTKILVVTLSNLSFGVYLMHMLFMEPIKMWLGTYHINYLFQIPLTAVIVLLLIAPVVYLVSKIPFAKYIIG